MNQVATRNEALPAHLQQGKTTSVGNVDATDRIIPRLKLLASISPEVEAFEKAKAGTFWHTLLEESLGDSVRIIPVLIRKEYTLWAPRGDNRGILARAPDAVNWDVKEVFDNIKVKNVAAPQKWDTTQGTVAGSGLDKWGSSVAGDPQSNPAAALTYTMMFLLADRLDLGPVVVINTRSAVKPCKGLISKIDLRPVDHFGQVFDMGVTSDINDSGDKYFNYKYAADGYADEAAFATAKSLYETFKGGAFRVNDEQEEEATAPDKGSKAEGQVGGKRGKI